MPPRLLHPFRPLLISLVLAIAIAVPLALIVQPKIDRHLQLSRLSSPDPAKVEQGLRYVVQHADDESLPETLVKYLDENDVSTMHQAYAAVASTGNANEAILLTPLIQRLQVMTLPDLNRTVHLFISHGHAQDPGVAESIAMQLSDATDDEFAQLYSLLELLNAWSRPTISDDDWVRWIALGHTQRNRDWPSGAPPLILASPDLADDPKIASLVQELAESELYEDRWAAINLAAGFASSANAYREILIKLRTTDKNSAIATQAWRALTIIAPSFTHPLPDDRELPLICGTFEPRPDLKQLDDPNIKWSVVLVTPRSPTAIREWQQLAADHGPDDPLSPIALAALYRLGTPGPLPEEANEAEWKRHLASLEGAADQSKLFPVQVTQGTPHLLRPVAVRVAMSPDTQWLWHTLLLDDRPAVRDRACLAVAERFSDEKISQLIIELFKTSDPEGRMSAAILSGLTGLQGELLQKFTDKEKRWNVQRMIEVGLWMQSDMPRLDGLVPAMLGRDGLPQSTLLLAMLHKGQRTAVLDELFSNQRTDEERLELLGKQRWAQVLYAYLPEDAPRVPLWADRDATLGFLRSLEAWHWVHRYTD